MLYDHVLLLAYGSPATPQEVKPYLESLIQAKELAPDCLAEQMDHIVKAGGSLPQAKAIEKLAEKLEKMLSALGYQVPVFYGMRHGQPSIANALNLVKKRKGIRGLAVILSPHKSELTYERYTQAVDAARTAAGVQSVQYEYLKVRHNHSLFIQAWADQARAAMRKLSMDQREFVHIVFTGRAIPRSIAQLCDYEKEVTSTTQQVAKDLNHPKWTLAYQSRLDAGKETCTEPDISSVIPLLNKEKERHVLVVPIGLVAECLETRYDLDIDIRKKAEASGFGFMRAEMPVENPKFVLSILDMLAEKLKG